jgi:hypothetical protein
MSDKIALSKHALERAASRGILVKDIMVIIESPLFISVEDGLSVYHGIIHQNNRPYLIRIFVNKQVNPNLVVTVYKTSKINKYYEGKI